MKPLASHDLLQAWLVGEERHSVDRTLTLLVFACPEKSWDELVHLNIARRDALLLELHAETFGPQLDGFTDCPECGERLEFSVAISDLLEKFSENPISEELTFSIEEYKIQGRLPNSLDLAAISRCEEIEDAHNLLLHNCIQQATKGDVKVSIEDLPEQVIAAAIIQVMESDSLSEIRFNLRCPECGNRWYSILDTLTYFWSEATFHVKRLLGEVDALARVYGWREEDILAMSTRRRQHYVQMVTR